MGSPLLLPGRLWAPTRRHWHRLKASPAADPAFLFFLGLFIGKGFYFSSFVLDGHHTSPRLGALTDTLASAQFFRLAFHGLLPMALLAPALIFKSTARRRVLFAANGFYSLLLVADLFYLRGYHAMPSPDMLKAITNLNHLESSVAVMAQWPDLYFLFDFAAAVGFLWLTGRKTPLARGPLARRSSSPRGAMVLASASVTALVLSIPAYRGVERFFIQPEYPVAVVNGCEPLRTAVNLSPLGYHGHSAFRYLSDAAFYRLGPGERGDIQTWIAANREALSLAPTHGIAKGMNLLVIQVESLEDFPIGRSYQGHELTPRLNGLLSHAFRFTRFHEQVEGGMSSDGDLMLNTGFYPVREGSTFYRFPRASSLSLPRLLAKSGYHSAVFHPDAGSYWNWMPALDEMGFQTRVDSSQYDLGDSFNMGISDESLFRQVAPRILALPKPCYAFVVTLSGHSPFVLPLKHQTLPLAGPLSNTVMGRYFQSVHYVDKQIGAFLDQLDQAGFLRNTLVAIYGDHESVHKYFPDEVHSLAGLEPWMDDNRRRVPLILYNPGFAGREVAATGGQVDLYPTLADLLGMDPATYGGFVAGRNLLGTRRDFAVLPGNQVVGDETDPRFLRHAQEGPEVFDRIIRGDFFKDLLTERPRMAESPSIPKPQGKTHAP